MLKPFKPNPRPTVGIEQELHLVSAESADLVPGFDRTRACLPADLQARVCEELLCSVIEIPGKVCADIAELAESAVADRRALAQAAAAAGFRLAAAGSHPFADWRQQEVVSTEHYQWVVRQNGDLARRMLAFGLHVHVGMRSGDAAIYAMNEYRRWLYPLLAFSANSPFFEGRCTGLQSHRNHIFRSLPRTGLPPELKSMHDVDVCFEKLRAAGDITRPGDLWWAVRPQPPLGTVEVRALDLPTDPARVAVFAAIIQSALACAQDDFTVGKPPSRLRHEYLEENEWQAMRYGLEGTIIEPETGEVMSMREQLGRLLELIRGKAAELKSEAFMEQAREMLKVGTEADWQLGFWNQNGHDLKKLEQEIVRRTV